MPHHILVLTDRDWTHPQGGGTGTHLYGLVSRWIAWGHRVTVVSAGYPGAKRLERPAPGLELHHLGNRLTVFARAAVAVRRGLAADSDVVLEIVNGIAFFTPLWRLRRPRVAFVHHVHRDMYVEELGRRGAIAAWLLETLPLRHLYGGTPFVTVSGAARDALIELGVAEHSIDVVHNGVEADSFPPGERSATPALLYLGRLKRYKRLEILLDVVAALPGVRLDVAGEGDHRAALEAEIAARGLGDRVTVHGHVSEERKRELLAAAWVNLTASSAEGWCLTVMEAAAAGTPSAALRVGGLAESIVDGETGRLAETPEELAAAVHELVVDAAERERLGRRAAARARTFTWERSAERVLGVLERTARRAPERLRVTLRRRLAGPTGVAAGTLASGAVTLSLTMILARALGASGYGDLATITSLGVVAVVPGAALQLGVAREAAAGALGPPPALAASVARWRRILLGAAVACGALGVLAREPLASLAAVGHPWAVACLAPAPALWLAVGVHRGALQGVDHHGGVALSLLVESGARLGLATGLVALGAGVTGAVAATPLALLLALAVLARRSRTAIGPAGRAVRGTLSRVIGRGWVPVAALVLLAAIQQLDIVVAKHRLGGAADAYIAAAVLSKSIVWVAAGLALALLPEVSRQVRAGIVGPGRLARVLLLALGIAAPIALLCILAAEPLLRLVFGGQLAGGASALPWLAVAMSLFACAFVAVEHALTLTAPRALGLLAAVAVAEPLALVQAGPHPEDLAGALAAAQLALVVAAIALGLRRAAPAGRPEAA